jgi:hypothetical protein
MSGAALYLLALDLEKVEISNFRNEHNVLSRSAGLSIANRKLV